MSVNKLIILIYFVLVPIGSVSAQTYYVSPNGNDANQGTLSSPWKTIAKANNVLRAGDTVLLRGGNYRESIVPSRSGTGENTRIIYAAHPGEVATIISASHKKIAIMLDNRSYITIDGIAVDGQNLSPDATFDQWANMSNADHCIIQNSSFIYGNNCCGKGIMIENGSTRNKILNNTFDSYGAPEKGDMAAIWGADHNLVEGNTFTKGGHNQFDISEASKFNIIRKNSFDGRWSENLGYRVVGIGSNTSTEGFNVVELNTFTGTRDSQTGKGLQMSVRMEGIKQIFRHNVIHNNVQSAISARSSTKGTNTSNSRFYHNTIYDNGGGGFVLNQNATTISGIVFKNNIVHKSRQSPETNADDADIVFKGKSGSGTDPANQTFFNNSITKSANGDAKIKTGTNGSTSLSYYESTYPSNFKNNISKVPQFVSANPAVRDDFKLQVGSPQINAGAFLTQTSGAGSGTTITVDDALYFTDGFGIVDGDFVQVGSNPPVQIQNIDYATNTLFVDRSISWSSNDNVSLPYNGTAPDIGAIEYGGGTGTSEANSPPNPPNLLQ